MPEAPIVPSLFPTNGELLVSGVTIALTLVALFAARKLVQRYESRASGKRFLGQVAMAVLTLLAAVTVILTLPIEDTSKGQLLTFFGILLSAAIALSATTFLGNVLAGLMLRSLRNFRAGDFVRVNDYFGRVTERGLFHVEIQTEDRDLVTLPNLYLATNPMTVVRASGTIVSAPVSLGYDAAHEEVRELLLSAATAAGLEEPFVRITALGDYTVEYRVGGLLSEVKELLSRRTRLRREMLDALHGGGIEIASPALLSLRNVGPGDRYVPRGRGRRGGPPAGGGLEALAFDKAEAAETIENLREELEALAEERAELEKRQREQTDETVKQALADELARLARREARLGKVLEARESQLSSPE